MSLDRVEALRMIQPLVEATDQQFAATIIGHFSGNQYEFVKQWGVIVRFQSRLGDGLSDSHLADTVELDLLKSKVAPADFDAFVGRMTAFASPADDKSAEATPAGE